MELGEKDEQVVVLTADLAESTQVLDFAKKYPERFVECGVAEQNMMGVAAGLALTVKRLLFPLTRLSLRAQLGSVARFSLL